MKIQRSYIYNLRQNEYGDLLFNVCVELPTIHERIRKTTIALRYHPDTGKMDVVTITWYYCLAENSSLLEYKCADGITTVDRILQTKRIADSNPVGRTKNKAPQQTLRGLVRFSLRFRAVLYWGLLLWVRYNIFRKNKKRHGLQISGRMKLRHTILTGDSKLCLRRLSS